MIIKIPFSDWGIKIDTPQPAGPSIYTTDAPAKRYKKKLHRPVDGRPKVRKKTLEYETSRGAGGRYLASEYDLGDVGRIETVESYVARSVKIKTSLSFKEGWDLVGANKLLVDYIRKCYVYMSYATDYPLEMLQWRVMSDLILYSNAYLIKHRDEDAAVGRMYQVGKKKYKPVAGYWPVHPAFMKVQKNDQKATRYQLEIPGRKPKTFPADDVIHFVYDRAPGALTGKPTIIPVIDDIRLLRRLEENVALMVYKHLFPLYHYTVGTDDKPAGIDHEGNREVDIARMTVEELPADGMLFTDHRHKIDAIGAESKALRAEGYLTQARQRVLTGLALSGIDIGEGETANRNTSDSLTRALIDHVKDFQLHFQWFGGA